jgi:hypothetical protein
VKAQKGTLTSIFALKTQVELSSIQNVGGREHPPKFMPFAVEVLGAAA